jgi:hypothetical protein
MTDSNFVMLKKLGEKDGDEIWLYRTTLGNYGIKHGGYSTCGSREDAMKYAEERLGVRTT